MFSKQHTRDMQRRWTIDEESNQETMLRKPAGDYIKDDLLLQNGKKEVPGYHTAYNSSKKLITTEYHLDRNKLNIITKNIPQSNTDYHSRHLKTEHLHYRRPKANLTSTTNEPLNNNIDNNKQKKSITKISDYPLDLVYDRPKNILNKIPEAHADFNTSRKNIKDKPDLCSSYNCAKNLKNDLELRHLKKPAHYFHYNTPNSRSMVIPEENSDYNKPECQLDYKEPQIISRNTSNFHTDCNRTTKPLNESPDRNRTKIFKNEIPERDSNCKRPNKTLNKRTEYSSNSNKPKPVTNGKQKPPILPENVLYYMTDTQISPLEQKMQKDHWEGVKKSNKEEAEYCLDETKTLTENTTDFLLDIIRNENQMQDDLSKKRAHSKYNTGRSLCKEVSIETDMCILRRFIRDNKKYYKAHKKKKSKEVPKTINDSIENLGKRTKFRREEPNEQLFNNLQEILNKLSKEKLKVCLQTVNLFSSYYKEKSLQQNRSRQTIAMNESNSWSGLIIKPYFRQTVPLIYRKLRLISTLSMPRSYGIIKNSKTNARKLNRYYNAYYRNKPKFCNIIAAVCKDIDVELLNKMSLKNTQTQNKKVDPQNSIEILLKSLLQFPTETVIRTATGIGNEEVKNERSVIVFHACNNNNYVDHTSSCEKRKTLDKCLSVKSLSGKIKKPKNKRFVKHSKLNNVRSVKQNSNSKKHLANDSNTIALQHLSSIFKYFNSDIKDVTLDINIDVHPTLNAKVSKVSKGVKTSFIYTESIKNNTNRNIDMKSEMLSTIHFGNSSCEAIYTQTIEQYKLSNKNNTTNEINRESSEETHTNKKFSTTPEMKCERASIANKYDNSKGAIMIPKYEIRHIITCLRSVIKQLSVITDKFIIEKVHESSHLSNLKSNTTTSTSIQYYYVKNEDVRDVKIPKFKVPDKFEQEASYNVIESEILVKVTDLIRSRDDVAKSILNNEIGTVKNTKPWDVLYNKTISGPTFNRQDESVNVTICEGAEKSTSQTLPLSNIGNAVPSVKEEFGKKKTKPIYKKNSTLICLAFVPFILVICFVIYLSMTLSYGNHIVLPFEKNLLDDLIISDLGF